MCPLTFTVAAAIWVRLRLFICQVFSPALTRDTVLLSPFDTGDYEVQCNTTYRQAMNRAFERDCILQKTELACQSLGYMCTYTSAATNPSFCDSCHIESPFDDWNISYIFPFPRISMLLVRIGWHSRYLERYRMPLRAAEAAAASSCLTSQQVSSCV